MRRIEHLARTHEQTDVHDGAVGAEEDQVRRPERAQRRRAPGQHLVVGVARQHDATDGMRIQNLRARVDDDVQADLEEIADLLDKAIGELREFAFKRT